MTCLLLIWSLMKKSLLLECRMFLEHLERLKKKLKFLRTLLCGIKLFSSVLGKASCLKKKKKRKPATAKHHAVLLLK